MASRTATQRPGWKPPLWNCIVEISRKTAHAALWAHIITQAKPVPWRLVCRSGRKVCLRSVNPAVVARIQQTTTSILRSAASLRRVSKDGREQPKSAVADFGDLRAEVGQARLPCRGSILRDGRAKSAASSG